MEPEHGATLNHSRGISRRTVLRGAGVAMALPLLEAMFPARLARGSTAGPVGGQRRRLVAICTTLGLHGPNLFPEQAGRDFVTSPYHEVLPPLPSTFTDLSAL